MFGFAQDWLKAEPSSLALFSLVGSAHHGQCDLEFSFLSVMFSLNRKQPEQTEIGFARFSGIRGVERKRIFIGYNKFTEETVEDV